MMAMEQRVAGVVGDEVDLRRRVAWHADRILHDSRGLPVADLGDLEAMAVQVGRMLVAAVVFHEQAVTLAALHGEQPVGALPRLAVDGSAVCITAATRATFIFTGDNLI